MLCSKNFSYLKRDLSVRTVLIRWILLDSLLLVANSRKSVTEAAVQIVYVNNGLLPMTKSRLGKDKLFSFKTASRGYNKHSENVRVGS